MDKLEINEIVNYLVKQGLSAIKENTTEENMLIDYVAIFSKDDNEYKNLQAAACTLGPEIDKETSKTGSTYFLKNPINTDGGFLKLLKIRKPDKTRPQRGAPDFKIKDYESFKNKYLQSSGIFTLMLKKDYEMIELKGEDVLVYIPNKPLSTRLVLKT